MIGTTAVEEDLLESLLIHRLKCVRSLDICRRANNSKKVGSSQIKEVAVYVGMFTKLCKIVDLKV